MFLRFEGQIHDSSHSVSTECEVYRIEEGEFVQQILTWSARLFWHASGQAHQTKHSVRTECAIQEWVQKCFKQLKAAKREAWDERIAAWRRPV